jgi:aspartate 1-decarboxylase
MEGADVNYGKDGQQKVEMLYSVRLAPAPQTRNPMLRQFLLGKIHRCRVTWANMDYVGSVSIDADLMDAAGFMENERVEVYNISNGSRFATYAIPAARGGGEVGINGAAAHLAKAGDLVILASYGLLAPEEAAAHRARVVLVDGDNGIAG